MPIILFSNLKGGVAKTTTAVAVSECFANMGFRTLLIDADHQCSASEMLLGEKRLVMADKGKITLHDLLAAMLGDEFLPRQISDYVVSSASNIGEGFRKLSVLPCSVRIDDFQTNMAKARRGFPTNDEFLTSLDRRRAQMRRWLSENFDYTIVDCPPSLAIQVKFFLGVAEGFIIPCVPDRLSVRGSLYLLDQIAKRGYKLKGIGTLWSLYREQNHIHREYIKRGKVQQNMPQPFETIIPNATAIADATDPVKSPSTFKAKYSPQFANLFIQLCEEIIRRTQWQPSSEVVKRAATTV